MFTTPQDNAGMGTHNPLAMQFMTQGQMGYMPQAQYLTSSDYGAYRTLPTAPDFMSQQHQSMSMWQSYLQSRRGNIGGMTGNYFFNTYDPMQSQTSRTVMAQRQFSDKMDSMKASTFGSALSFAPATIMGAALGPVGMVGGAALSMAMPGVGDHMAQRRRQGRQIQNMSMPGITLGPDMAQGVGQGFSLRASSQIVSGIRKKAVDDFSFRQDDYTKFLQAGVSSGLTDYSGTAGQYSQVVKQLRDNVKMMAEFLENKDVQGLFEDMKRIQTMGGSLKGMNQTIATESMFARSAGLGHADMVSTYGAQGALQYTQRGMTGVQGSLQAMGQAASVTMAMRSGLISPDALSRAGGKSGLTQSLTTGTASGLGKVQKFMLPALTDTDGNVDTEMLRKYTSGEISYKDLMATSAGKLGNVKDALGYRKSSAQGMHNLQEQLGTVGTDVFLSKTALQMGQTVAPDADRKTQLYTGFIQMGYTHEAANMQSEKYSDPAVMQGQADQLKVQNRKSIEAVNQELANKDRPWNRVKHSWRKFTQGLSSQLFGGWEERRAEQADRKENERVGIYSTSTGVVGGVVDTTTEDYVGSASDLQDDLGAFTEDRLSGVNGEKPIYKDLANLYSNKAEVAFKEKFLAESTLSADERREGFAALGMNGFEVRELMKGFKAKNVNREGMIAHIARKKNISKEEAAKIVDNDTSMALLSEGAMAEMGDRGIREIEEDKKELNADIAEYYRDVSDKAYDKAESSVEDLVGGDRDRRDSLLKYVKGADTVDGKNVALEGFGIAAMVRKLGGKKLWRGKVSVARDKVTARLKDMGASPEQIKDVLGGDTKTLETLLIDNGMEVEDAKDLIKLGGGYSDANKWRSVDEVDANLDKAQLGTRMAPAASAMTNVHNKMTDVFGAAGKAMQDIDITNLLGDRDAVKKLFDSLGDGEGAKEHKKFLTQVMNAQEGGGDFATVLAKLVQGGVIGGAFKEDVTEMSSTATTEQKEAEQQRQAEMNLVKEAVPTMNKLNKVLDSLSANLDASKNNSGSFWDIIMGKKDG